ncbi:ankyrin repeat-containing protein At5g02620-like [Salvia hispanica]|uniref:ankyrin repeat-containing protein At5g02620-like n=1 Tax=Salvia hispanica TaxID=49212 RepID=UPI002009444D|nr:ankyrin repeat-containing protein At5g02620-like [Salvia hispanica]
MAEKKLYDAATIGDLATLQQLLQANQHLLDVVSFPCLKNVLHIAIKHGKDSIVEEVLKINPELALELDSKNTSSLHLAAARGNVVIAKRLLAIAPEMCWWQDGHDMNPLHVAAMKGNEAVLEEMLQLDTIPATARLHRGQTVLHLCVKHRQLGTFTILVDKLGDLVNAQDDDGETLLHFAVRANQLEIVEYLKENNKLEKLTKNSAGKTALDILNESVRDQGTYTKMKTILKKYSNQSIFQNLPRYTEMTMVAAILIATMAFQAAISPPGGVRQEDGFDEEKSRYFKAGSAVMAVKHPKTYKQFVNANIVSFVSSTIAILLLSTAGSSDQWIFVSISTSFVWLSMASIAATYGASLVMTNPNMVSFQYGNVILIIAFIFGPAIHVIYIFGSTEIRKRVKRLVKKVSPNCVAV